MEKGEQDEHSPAFLTVDSSSRSSLAEPKVLLSCYSLSSISILDSPLQTAVAPAGGPGTASWAPSLTALSHGWPLWHTTLCSERDRKNTSAPGGKHGSISSYRSTGDNSGRRREDLFYYSGPGEGVRSPRWLLQRAALEVTSNTPGLSDSCRRRHSQSNSQVPWQRSPLWRLQRDHERWVSNTGQSFDPIRGCTARAFMRNRYK